MRKHQRRLLGLGISIFGMSILPLALLGQASPDSAATFPVTSDWSHHHVIYSRPATAEQAERLKRDPRYLQQLSRHSQAHLPMNSVVQLGANASLPRKNRRLKRDWAEDLGSGASVGATNYPAKYSFNTNVANCATDFAVYATGLLGSSGQASIVAYNNIYSGCGGTVPSVYWAYDTGATITTSPVFSLDGTQIAFVQTNSLGHGIVVLLKWVASSSESVGHPVSLTRVSHASYPTCTAPCMTTAVLPGGVGVFDADTNSSIFYDYSNDVAYVGDNAGFLHKFTPFFLGVPTEVTVGWPVQVNPGAPTALNSPVHDFGSRNVFVTDNGGFLYRVDSTGAVTTSSQLDVSSGEGGTGIVQGPIVDSTAGLVYVFASSDGSAGCVGGADCSAVYQLGASFVGGDTGTEALVGTSTVFGTAPAPSPLYIGAFDSTYENSTDPPTGNLYVCGNTGGTPVLYQVPITTGAFGTINPGPGISATVTTPCSPVTDVYNPNTPGGATEGIFVSVETDGPSSICSGGGCIFNFKDTPWKAATSYSVGQQVIDTHFQVQVVSVAGRSGGAAPSWQILPGKITTDSAVRWIDQGVPSAFPLAAWAPNHLYSKGQKILDNNNPQNIQLVTSSGAHSSGSTIPSFNAAPGGTTHDPTGGLLVWTNVGAPTTAALAASGGTSGVIIDNTVSTLAGASNVYFSTLGNQACGTSGTGGCAVQASQSGLK